MGCAIVLGKFMKKSKHAETVVEIGIFSHICEGESICRLTTQKVPFFNAQIYLADKTPIGLINEIFGPINATMISVKMAEGVKAKSFLIGEHFYIDPLKLIS